MKIIGLIITVISLSNHGVSIKDRDYIGHVFSTGLDCALDF